MFSIKQAFGFIRACFSLALKHPSLQEPWFVLGVGGLVVLLAGLLPIAAVVGWIGLTPIGLLVIGLFSTLTVASLLIWGEVTALRTAQAFHAIDRLTSERPSSHVKNLTKHGSDIVTLILTVPLLRLSQSLRSVFKPNAPPANSDRVWLDAHALALPVIALEGLPLRDALARLNMIVEERLVRFQTKLIPVRPVAILVQTILTATGILVASWVALSIASPQTATAGQRILAAGIGALIAWFPTMAGILFSAFTRACYATALYLWVCDVEIARQTGNLTQVSPPVILSQVFAAGATQPKDR